MVPGLAVVLLAVTLGFLGREGFNPWIVLAVLLGGWVALGVLRDAGAEPLVALATLARAEPKLCRNATAHLGSGCAGSRCRHSAQRRADLRMAVGDTGLGGYRFELIEIGQRPGLDQRRLCGI